MPEEFKRASLETILELLRSREIRVTQLMEWTIAEVEEVHRRCNTVVHRFFEEAMGKAREYDELYSRKGDHLPPLAGVPFSIKGTFAVESAPWVVGSRYRKGMIASFTDPGVKRLMERGAIPVCLTNTPEVAFWIETYNKVYGLTRNPFDPWRSAGGSSGGEAVLVGSGALTFGLGSDTGGSIRIPSAFCGACGFKPTPFSIPNDGHFPMPPRPLRYLMASGPITRYARDLPLLLRSLCEPSFHPSFESFLRVDLREIELFLYLNLPGGRVDPEVVQAVEEAGEIASSLGVKLRPFTPPSLRDAFSFCISALAEGDEILMPRILKGKESMNLGWESLRYAMGFSPHTLPLLTLSLLERVLKGRFSSWVRERNEERIRFRLRLIESLGQRGLLLGPVYPTPAPLHFEPLRKPWQWAYTGIYNALGFPALSLPWGRNKGGLPLAIQIAGPPGSDGLVVRLAMALEEARGGGAPS
jgi:fatty acid amide hydrolase 2